jgi:hypothetical protein
MAIRKHSRRWWECAATESSRPAGSMDRSTPSFLAWVVQFLVPGLGPEDIVMTDNLSSHENIAVRRAIRSTGAKLFFLPP